MLRLCVEWCEIDAKLSPLPSLYIKFRGEYDYTC